jgi:hypothetical protein
VSGGACSYDKGADDMNTYEKRFWYGVAILVVTGSILFLSALFLGYVSDEWGKPPIDEESAPAAKTS